MISTLVLLAGGTFFYYLLEMDNTLAGLPFRGQLANAFLGAVTPRTAGFCVADMGTLTTGTLMLTLILMIIGAAPMSTGGGLKVTTVCVALLTAHNAARGKENVEIRKREISPETIRRAFATIVFYFCWLGAAVWILSITEKDISVFTLTFEVVSALSTVGLSLNFSVTEHFGKTGHHLHHAGRTYRHTGLLYQFLQGIQKEELHLSTGKYINVT